MFPIHINIWYTCIPDKKTGQVELCRINAHGKGDWIISTYYDGQVVYRGTLNDCLHWVNVHFMHMRYLDENISKT